MSQIDNRGPRAGFTLTDLIAVVAAVLLAGSLAWGGIDDVINASRASKCAQSIRIIGLILKVYDDRDAGVFPTIRPKDTVLAAANVMNEAPMAKTATDTWTNTGRAALGNCPMQEMWPLMVSGLTTPPGAIFHCPGDAHWRPRRSNLKYGWTSPNQFSYGIQWPYAGIGPARPDGTPTVPNMAPPCGKGGEKGLVVLADQNPGGPVVAGKTRHSNHPDGCNALKRDGAVVKYEKDGDSKAGLNGDDIYVDQVTAGVKPADPAKGLASDTVPDDVSDTVIVPVSMPKEN